jgi:hypothetical protein
MWRVLRAELVYFRSYLLVAWSIAFGVALLVNLLTLIGGGDDRRAVVTVATILPGIFFIIAAMIVGFIAQGTRSDERRARLLLAGLVTPRQLGAVLVLLPACLIGLGALASALTAALAALITGQPEPTLWGKLGVIAGQMFAIVMLGPLAQESSAAHRQCRNRAAVAGWTGFVLAILLLATFQVFGTETSISVILGQVVGQVVIAVTAMVVSAIMYAGRTDFTR